MEELNFPDPFFGYPRIVAQGYLSVEASVGGITEIAKYLGLSRQRVSVLAKTHPAFPKPVVTLACGSIWYMQGIKDFNEGWTRKSGRPKKVKN